MSALFGTLLSEWWPHIMAALAAIGAFLGIYLKGRSDQKAKAKLEDVSNANEIRKAGADARASSSAGRLHDSDGWRRD